LWQLGALLGNGLEQLGGGEGAGDVLDRAGPGHSLWLVWSAGYKSLGHRCEQLRAALSGYRTSGDDVRLDWISPEHMGLVRFDPASQYDGSVSHRCSAGKGC